MKRKHAQKYFGAIGTMVPTPLSLKTWVAGGCRIQGPPPPREVHIHTFRGHAKSFSGVFAPKMVPVVSCLVDPTWLLLFPAGSWLVAITSWWTVDCCYYFVTDLE